MMIGTARKQVKDAEKGRKARKREKERGKQN